MKDSKEWVFVPYDATFVSSSVLRITGTKEEAYNKAKLLFPEETFYQYSAEAFAKIQH